MRLAASLALLLALTLPVSANAASYQQVDGTIVDPIVIRLDLGGGTHAYCCTDLEPFALLSGANLGAADLFSADLSGADLTNANLGGADLSNASLFAADLNGTSLTGAILSNADLSGAFLFGVHSGGITGIPLALPPNWELVYGYLFGQGAALIDADLSGADLSGAYLLQADLSGANLASADVSNAILASAILSNAILSNANLAGAILIGADLTNADLAGANLTGANLSNADLSGALYNEVTIFPSGGYYDSPPWGLPDNAIPWDLFMVPAPEPTSGLMLGIGGLALLAMGRRRMVREAHRPARQKLSAQATPFGVLL